MRKCFVIALAVSSIVSSASLASAQSATPTPQGRVAQRGHHRDGLFKGLNLSADEKARIKDVRSKYRADNLKLRQSTASAMAQARTARQKGDTAGARSILEGTKASRDAMRASMARQNNEIRSSLSAENQKQFDANAKQFAGRHKGFMKNHKKGAQSANG
jgi:Spy/CpxP family protein refolding chaperone